MSRVLVTMSGRHGDDLGHEVRERHLRSLREAGLTPICVAGSASAPEVSVILDVCDAAYLPGTDYVPSSLGEREEASRRGAAEAGLPWDPWKVRADLLVLEEAWQRRVPVLGICGGMQAMAVRAGGNLRPTVGTEIEKHRSVTGGAAVTLAADSLAAATLGEVTETNSFHRQVVEQETPGLDVTGVAADGTVEAVEAPAPAHPFWLGLQWHPELLGDDRPFRALASAAAERRR
jgi:putative glutamine amidotransferase